MMSQAEATMASNTDVTNAAHEEKGAAHRAGVTKAPHEKKEAVYRGGEEKTVTEDGQEGYASGDGVLRLLPTSTRNKRSTRTSTTQRVATEFKSAENSPIMSRRESRLPSTGTGTTTATTFDNHGGNPADNVQQPPFPARRRLRIYRAGNRTNKWVTRELAALDFLTGIRMRNETAIRARGANGARGGMSTEDDNLLSSGGGRAPDDRSNWPQQLDVEGASPEGLTTNAGAGGAQNSSGRAGGNTVAVPHDDDTDSEGGWLDQPLPSAAGGGSGGGGGGGGNSTRLRGTPGRGGSVAGVVGTGGRISSMGSPAPARRLRGREAAHVRVPASFRHCMMSLPGHSAAVVRQWEQGLTQQVGMGLYQKIVGMRRQGQAPEGLWAPLESMIRHVYIYLVYVVGITLRACNTIYELGLIPLTRFAIGDLRGNDYLKVARTSFCLSCAKGASAGRTSVLLVLQRLPGYGVVRHSLQAARGAG